ncbi:P-loop containing nucleoside triphosphate hydrolase protein [Crassisporium funariophilum]|nr:P-loop containing nucleoside triphosphate hydrolase protein [Crassisporium funariophilum]
MLLLRRTHRICALRPCSKPGIHQQYGTDAQSNRLIISIPSTSNIYAFGSPSRSRTPLLRDISWTVEDGEAWAVVSSSGGNGKGVVFKTLLGHTRIAPPTLEAQARWAAEGGLYPFLSSDPYTRISHVSFRQRTGGDSGAFFDYTARYGAMREAEDRVTLRDNLAAGDNQHELFETLITQMNLGQLLDLPLLALSNGQTRRARVVKAILNKPELLLLDEPLTGLDPPSRKILLETLRRLHLSRSPRIILGLRKGEEVPSWITNVLEIQDGTAVARKSSNASPWLIKTTEMSAASPRKVDEGSVLVDMKDVNVVYGTRKILESITWQIKQGERWHLQGPNGSGKTTLLALLTGDHPQSYTQAHLQLPTTSDGASSLRPRKRIPTAHLRTSIGVVSPEMFDAFPRRHPGMSLWEAVGTGFNGGFVPRSRGASNVDIAKGCVGWLDVDDEELGLGWETRSDEDRETRREDVRKWRVGRCWEVLEALGPAAWSTSKTASAETIAYASLPFSSISPGEQRLVLLMRALVGKPPLVLLDEAWSGMDDGMIAAARRYLRGEVPGKTPGVGQDQAVVVITHWEDEVPWVGEEVKKFRLG